MIYVAARPAILSLCSGIGGLDLGVRLAMPGASTVGYVEREAFAAATLVARMEEAALDQAPIWDDLATFDGRAWRGLVDGIIAGFPCQPLSFAGKRAKTEDDRWLWPEIARIISDVGPAFVFMENVSGLLHGGIEHVLGSLAEMGFDAEWGLFSAAEVGATHKRDRVFLLAYTGCFDPAWCESEPECWSGVEADDRGTCESLADAEGQRRPQRWAESTRQQGRSGVTESGRELGHPHSPGLALGNGQAPWEPFAPTWPPGPGDHGAWREILKRDPTLEPSLCGMADGTSYRVDGIRALGNGVVPLVAAYALRTLAARAMTP